MTVQYEMRVTRMDVYPEMGGKTDVVHRVYWTLTASNGERSYSYQSKTDTPYNPNGPWLEYDSLTENDVLTWISKTVPNEISAVRQSLALNFPNEPVSADKPLPWE